MKNVPVGKAIFKFLIYIILSRAFYNQSQVRLGKFETLLARLLRDFTRV